MSSAPEHLGTTKIYSCAYQFLRTWHVWATHELDGELIAVYYCNSSNFLISTGPVKKKDCDSVFKRQIWQFAEERLASGLIFDEVIDDEVESSNVIPLRRR